jgi:hypothetical protein
MSNRSNTAPIVALDARRSLTAQLRSLVRDVPPSPCAWAEIDWNAAFAGSAGDPRLSQLSALLCDAPARVAELRALWNESVATSAFAWRLAPHLGADQETSALAGLLHRLGDALTIRAIATLEHATGVRLDAASKADLCAEHTNGLLEQAVRAWGVPPRAAAMAAAWRRLRDFPGAAADAAVVPLARFMAIERVSPRFCAPGIVESAAEELDVSPAVIGRVRDETRLERFLLV